MIYGGLDVTEDEMQECIDEIVKLRHHLLKIYPESVGEMMSDPIYVLHHATQFFEEQGKKYEELNKNYQEARKWNMALSDEVRGNRHKTKTVSDFVKALEEDCNKLWKKLGISDKTQL